MSAIQLPVRLGWAILCAGLSGPLAVQAQQALVMTQDTAALEIGQAFLAHYGGECYAIMPTHVALEASRPALLREGAPPLLGEALDWTDLGDDIAIAQVNGAIKLQCGPSALTIQRSVEQLLRQGRLGTLRAINGDGTVAQLAVTIVDDDGKKLLRIQPTRQGDSIGKGQSGSQLMIGGVVVGMLLSVDTNNETGTVARIDRVMAKVDAHLMNGLNEAGSARTTAASHEVRGVATGAGPEKTERGLRVTAWNSLPVSSANPATNLVAGDDSPPWISEPRRWPVTLDFGAGGEIMTVGGVVLDGTGVADAGQLPSRVEVFINLSGERGSWRSIVSTPVEYRQGVARIDFAQMRARMIRLSFSGAADGGKVLALRRISLRDK